MGMSDAAPEYVIDPNRVRATGAEDLDAVALSLRIGDGGVVVGLRTGAFTDRTLELSYDELVAVDAVSELSYGLVVETAETAYTVTNVTASDDEIDAIVRYVRERVREARRARETERDDGVDDSGPDGESTENGSADGDDPDATGGESAATELQRWTDLYEQGVITEEELQEKKRELL